MTQLGFTEEASSTTISAVYAAMPIHSRLFVHAQSFYSTEYPSVYGSIELIKGSSIQRGAVYFHGKDASTGNYKMALGSDNLPTGTWIKIYGDDATTCVPVTRGGTGATTTAAARTSLSVPGAAYTNGYWGLTQPDGTTTGYYRTPQTGLIPYQSGGNGTVGTSSWPFSTIYGNTLYEGGTALSSKYASKAAVLWTNSSGSSSFAAQTLTLSALSSYALICIIFRDTTSDTTQYAEWIHCPVSTGTYYGGHYLTWNSGGSWYSQSRSYNITRSTGALVFGNAYYGYSGSNATTTTREIPWFVIGVPI